MKQIYRYLKGRFQSSMPGFYNRLDRRKTIVKYLIAGSTAAAIDLVLLYILTDIFGLWYLFSACLAFIIAFFVSFFLQKFWTFRDDNRDKIYQQMSLYFIVGTINLGVNAGGMYVLVDKFEIMYILAQIMMGGVIAIGSFLIYRFVIFRKHKPRTDVSSGRDKLKILIATGIFPPDIGGPAHYAENLVKEFSFQGYLVAVLSYRLEKVLPPGLRHGFYFWRVICNIFNKDVIIALDTFSVGLPSVLAAKIFKKKIIIRIGGDFLWESYVERSGNLVTIRQFYEKRFNLTLKERIIFWLTMYTLKNCSALVFSTEWQKNIFEKYYNLNPKYSFIIENFYGKKIEDFKPKEKNFIWAGRSIKLKNIKMLASIFEDMEMKNRDIKLEIITEESHSELVKRLQGCYAVILPSLSDISPNFILDAIRVNKPFILTKETGFYDKLKDIGVFIDPLDKEDIKRKVLLLTDNEHYTEYKRRVGWFKFTHSWKQISEEFLRIYQKL